MMESQESNGTVEAIAASTNRFAFDLYHQLRATPGTENLIYSPYSLAAILTMTYAGARGETAQQMADVLHLTLPPDELHAAMGAQLADYIAEKPGVPALTPEVALAIFGDRAKNWSDVMLPPQVALANALWGQQDYPFRAEYLALLDEHYNSALREMDFAAASEPARQTINDWVSDETNDRIPELLPPGSIDSATRLVLTNTVYFKGGWNFPFEAADTRDGLFTRLDGSTVTVPLMYQEQLLWYTASETAAGGFQVVGLGYHASQISMMFLLPDVGCFAAFEESLDAGLFQSIRAEWDYVDIHLTLPRFRATSGFNLSSTLAALGMPDVFDAKRAEFSGMAEPVGDPLFLAEVFHQAFITVDEIGTEAGAATAVLQVLGTQFEGPIELTLDRPFIYAICDQTSGAILFLGRVLDPSV
jgi:serpin B